MAINHIESNIAGDKYRRAKTVVLNNPKGGTKSITYAQEDVINLLDGTSAFSDTGSLVVALTDDIMTKKIDMINPATGDILGQKTVAEMVNTAFVFLHSLYIHQENLQNAQP